MTELVFKPRSHTYWLGDQQLPNITSICPSDYSHVPPATLERARQRGHAVHRLTELYDLDILKVLQLDWTTVHHDLLPYLDAWIKAVHDLDIHFEAAAIEKPTYHPLHRFAGTPDRGAPESFVWVMNVNSVVEIKSVAQMTKETEYQTSAEKCEINYWRRKLGLQPVLDRWAIQLKPNGKYKAVKHEDPTNEPVFLARTLIMHEEVKLGRRKYPNSGMLE